MATTETPTEGHTVRGELDPYLDSLEVAKVLGVHRTSAWRLMRAGAIPDVVDVAPVGAERALLRIRRSDLLAWLKSRAL